VDDVDVRSMEGAADASGSHVTVSKSVGPSLCEDGEAVRVRLDLEDRFDIEPIFSQGCLDAEV